MFPENVLFDFVLLQLEEDMAGYVPPVPQPMRCDRWIARSSMQKATRRGQVEVAQAALATLLDQDRYGIWRHLTVIALEDVGVAGMDLISQVVAAGRNRAWRKTMGGEWAVASFLVRQMAETVHCQAACDLLLVATNSGLLERARTDALDAEAPALVRQLSDNDVSLAARAVAALALAGALADEQRHREPDTVLDVLAGTGKSSHVIAICRAAWRTSRNPMALLLPLVWERWMSADAHEVRDDGILPATMIGDVPDYAIDQFTRVGGQVARAYLAGDTALRELLDFAVIPRGQQPRMVGDLLFLVEGGLVARRAIWGTGDDLRFPHRPLPAVARLGERLEPALRLVVEKGQLIAKLRSQHLHPPLT